MANSSNDAVKVVGTVVLMCMLFSVPYMAEAITCGKVLQDLVLPCYSYLRKGGAVTSGCCGAVRDVNSAAQTTTDRRVVCGCLQSAPRLIREINSSRLASLPGKCGVSIPYKISPSTHCSKVV
ncbi:hypothetical protein C5167_002206 [Papaver somniferum]|uniref:Non-specific lipid-transfer protein n=1 Tax=Papaver somniferum TaxID=3469 RepID=A0A4Y7KYZ2_PAPSO|nr:non-specific lipid-transfer protein 1-like [Papaver somniferum]RZC77987.1 hypothetical protein C5167_002206 [Papaver somniferum]